MTILRRLAEGIVSRAGLVLAGLGIVTVLAAAFAVGIHIDSSAEGIVDRADPADVLTREMRKVFGHEEIDVVVVESDDLFSTTTLETIRRLTDRIAALPGVEEAEGLTSVRVTDETAEGVVEYAPVVGDLPLDDTGLARLRRLAKDNPFLANTFVSSDGRASAIIVRYQEMPEHEFIDRGIHDAVERVVEEERANARVSIFGAPSMKAESARFMRNDLMRFTNGTTIVVGAILLFCFRTIIGVALPLVAVGLGLVWTVGAMAATGTPLDVLGLVLPSILLAVGSAYATHVVARYYDEARQGGTRAEIVTRTLRRLTLPVFVTALTTVLGFASLAAYRVSAIRNLGIFLAFGTIALLAIALTFIPAVLARLPLVSAGRAPLEPEWPRLRALLERIVRFDLRRRVWVLGAGAILLVVALAGITRIRIETDYSSYFPEGSAIATAKDITVEHFGGTTSFYVIVEGAEADAVLSLPALRRLEAIQDFIDRIPGVVKTLSIVDVVEVANRALGGSASGELTLPEVEEAVPQLLLLVPPAGTEAFVSGDGRIAAIHVRSHLTSSRLLRDALARIERFGADSLPPGYRLSTAGTSVVLNRAADALSAGQVSSVIVATIVVFSAMSLFFVSIRLGLVAMIPNLVPIAIFFGLLGWLDIPLSISTGVIASIALGIGVDEAIHLLAEFKHHIQRVEDQDDAVVAAMSTVGPAVVITTIALSLGFLVPALSSFVPIRQFALLASMNVVISLLADLFLLPACLATMRFVTLWELLTTRFGRAPQETIPLFAGLRPAQAKSVVLMGKLRRCRAGETIMEKGIAGDSVAILIDGEAEVSVPSANGHRTVLRRLVRGDVVGELSLLLGHPRTADVVAVAPSELLIADALFFEHLRDRHPRVAAILFYNLSRILGDRVLSLTTRVAA
jgi:uncharacterized protein